MADAKQVARKIFEMQCQICKAMANPLRLHVVELLSRRAMSAKSLLAALETSKANLSKHMNQLIAAGIVESHRKGRQVHYSLPHPEIHEACRIMRSILYRRLKHGANLASAISKDPRV